MSRSRLGHITCVLASLSLVSISYAVNTASNWTSYDHGNPLTNPTYNDPNAALHGLKPIADPFNGTYLTPFNAPYTTDDIVIVGGGGHLTLQFEQPVALTASGPQIGVFVNNNLNDAAWPTGLAMNPAQYVSPMPQALVSVSQNGTDFFPLSGSPISFDGPSNYYADLGDNPSNNNTGGSVVADMSKPFVGHLSDFDGKNWSQIKTVLDGSAGGTWLDFRTTPLTQVNYVRFDVPVDPDPQHPTNRFVLDAISAVPEPGTLTLSLGVFASIALRRRRPN